MVVHDAFILVSKEFEVDCSLAITCSSSGVENKNTFSIFKYYGYGFKQRIWIEDLLPPFSTSENVFDIGSIPY